MTASRGAARQPSAFSRRVLLMVTGRTPQVVTETLYGLCVKSDPPFVPTEVHLVTTAEGARGARIALLSADKGWFHRFCVDYELHGLAFSMDQVHVIEDADGRPAEDIRTLAEHEACADLITEQVRGFTADPDCALHVSLAGGRKTMTYYLGNALTLFGRIQDRLSHVLVPAPFESNPEFFYPTPYQCQLYSNRMEIWLDARDAEVTLADIPFVRLRDSLPNRFKGLEEGRARFTEVVTALQQALMPAAVRIDYGAGGLHLAGDRFVSLSGADLAFYGWHARRRLHGIEPARIPPKDPQTWGEGRRETFAQYLREYEAEADRTKVRANTGRGRAERRLEAMTYQFFHQRMTSIREQLEEAVGPLADAYVVKAVAAGRPAGYGLDIPVERIEITEEGYL